MPVNLYYTQRIRGFQQESVKYNTSRMDRDAIRNSLSRNELLISNERQEELLEEEFNG